MERPAAEEQSRGVHRTIYDRAPVPLSFPHGLDNETSPWQGPAVNTDRAERLCTEHRHTRGTRRHQRGVTQGYSRKSQTLKRFPAGGADRTQGATQGYWRRSKTLTRFPPAGADLGPSISYTPWADRGGETQASLRMMHICRPWLAQPLIRFAPRVRSG